MNTASSPERAVTVALASPGQRQLWMHDRLYAHDGSYNISLGLRLDGPLDVDALRQAFAGVVARHEPLRTRLTLEDEDVYQVIAEASGVDLPVVDIGEAAPTAAYASVVASLERDGARPFDLAAGPLWRATVYRMAPSSHALTLVIHHTVFDGWSVDIFVRELGHLYEAALAGRAANLPELHVQFADFAAWQREHHDGASSEPARAYWQRQLADAPPHLDLPTDHPRGRSTVRRGQMVRRPLPSDLRARAAALARTEDATLFMVLHTAFSVVLHRYCRQTDLVVGTPVAGRTREEFEPLIGDFISTVLLRSRVAPDESFLDLLRATRRTMLDAFTHQDIPFDRMQQYVGRDRGLSDRFQLQVLVAFQSATPTPAPFGGLAVSLFFAHNGTAKYDLFLNIEDDDAGLRLELEYDSDLFAAATAERLFDSFLTALHSAVAQPRTAIAALPLVSETDVAVMARANATGVSFEGPAVVHEMIAAGVARAPDRVAVRAGTTTWTYADLHARATAIAAELARQGATRGSLVGIYLTRSADMVAAVLGVWMTGAAYVPVDPSYPAERIRFVLDDAAAPIVLTDAALEGSLPAAGALVISLDRLPHTDAAFTPADSAADDLAYVIYTSGSTGKPKGVEISHRGLANLLHAMRRSLGFAEHDRLLAVTTLSFDIAGLELFLPLVTGATVVIAAREQAADPAALAQLLTSERITVMQATPTTWRLLVESGWPGHEGLRALVGGEALPPDLARALVPRAEALWNVYGPTETTIWSMATRVVSDEITIGQPIANTDILIVDAENRAVPIGVPGELLIGGLGVARGYRGRPELTAAKFIPHPHDPRRRVFRTGDQCRWRADGHVEFLGRLDHQVKIRGFRIELGEIEAALVALPGVAHAVAMDREDGHGGRRLVAYVVPLEAPGPSPDTLRSGLAMTLPDYMWPAAYVTLDHMPLTPNGKIDRKALPEPSTAASAHGEYVAPRSDLETRVAALWADVLGLDRIGIDDDFFHIGGHSLAALKVFSRIETTMGTALPLATLFEAPTVRTLTRVIEQAQAGTRSTTRALAVIKDGQTAPLVCVHSFSGDVLEYRDIARHLPASQTVWGLQAVLDDQIERVYQTVEATARAYVHDVREAQPTGPYYLCGWSSAATVVLEMAQQLMAAGETVALLAVIDAAPVHAPAPAVSRLVTWARLVANVPAWIRDDLMHADTRSLMARVRQRAARLVRSRGARGPESLDLRDVVNFPPRSEAWERFGALHFRAVIDYVPTPYPGRVSVFTAPTHPLTRLNDPVPSWKQLCAHVDVYPASGTHASLVREPHVRLLAARLAEAIRRSGATHA